MAGVPVPPYLLVEMATDGVCGTVAASSLRRRIPQPTVLVDGTVLSLPYTSPDEPLGVRLPLPTRPEDMQGP